MNKACTMGRCPQYDAEDPDGFNCALFATPSEEECEFYRTGEEHTAIKELFNALEGMVSVAETECWESATTGRQILLADAKAVIEKYKDAK